MFAKTKEKPKEAPSDMQKMQGELTALKDKERLRARYGANLKDEQLLFYQAQEEKEAKGRAVKAEGDRLGKIAAAAREKEIKALAVEMVKSGRMLVTVRGKRINTVSKDLTIPCPGCGSEMSLVNPLFIFAEIWHDTPENSRFNGLSRLVIRSARNPLGNLCGAPLFIFAPDCHSCKATSHVMVELVVL
jgi:hypothetical protein